MLREMLHPTSASDVLIREAIRPRFERLQADPPAVLSRGGRAEAERPGVQRDRPVPALPDGPADRRAADRAGGVRGARPGLSDGPYHVVLPGGAGLRAPARTRRGRPCRTRRAVARAEAEVARWSWIAIKMLVGDRAKFLGIVLGLTFAALLITQQGSIFCGLMLRTCGQITDITGADLWVMDPAVRYIDDVKPMLENNLYRVRGVEGVRWAVPLYKGTARVEDQPRRCAGQSGDRDRAGDPAGAGRRELGRGAATTRRSWPATCATCGSPTPSSSTTSGSTKLYPDENWDELPTAGQGVLSAVPPPPVRDERPSGGDRRRLRGDADLPVQPGRLHDLHARQDLRSPGTEDPLVHPGQDRARDCARERRRAGSRRRPAWAPRPATSSRG